MKLSSHPLEYDFLVCTTIVRRGGLPSLSNRARTTSVRTSLWRKFKRSETHLIPSYSICSRMCPDTHALEPSDIIWSWSCLIHIVNQCLRLVLYYCQLAWTTMHVVPPDVAVRPAKLLPVGVVSLVGQLNVIYRSVGLSVSRLFIPIRSETRDCLACWSV